METRFPTRALRSGLAEGRQGLRPRAGSPPVRNAVAAKEMVIKEKWGQGPKNREQAQFLPQASPDKSEVVS